LEHYRQPRAGIHDIHAAAYGAHYRPNTPLEIVFVDIYDTPHNHRPNFQGVAYQDVHEGLQILYTR